MNILFYIPNLTQENGGVRQYATNLLKILAADDKRKYFVYHYVNDPEVNVILKANKHLLHISHYNLKDHKKVRYQNRVKRLANLLLSFCRLKKRFAYWNEIDWLCVKYKIDVIHCPYQFLPSTTRVKLITTMHDVQELHFPEFFTPEQRAERAVTYLDFLKRADSVVVSYQHVKEDLIKYFNLSEDKVRVVHLDMQNLWFERFKDADILPVEQIVPFKDFLLYPANTWMHKNHIRLLKSIAFLRDEFGVEVNVVCTGYKNTHYSEIEQCIQELKLVHQIQFLGVVQELALYSLYKRCMGVVVPTLYEAGSFPVVESILLQIPVICSNVTSLPETIGDEKFLFDPFSTEAIAFKLKEFWEREDFRKKSIQNSQKVGFQLTQTNALDKILCLYDHLYSN